MKIPIFLHNFKILQRLFFSKIYVFYEFFTFILQVYHKNNNGTIVICYRLSNFSSCFAILRSIVPKSLIFIVFKVNVNFLHKINCIGKVPTSIFCLLRCIFSQTKGQKDLKDVCLPSFLNIVSLKMYRPEAQSLAKA